MKTKHSAWTVMRYRYTINTSASHRNWLTVFPFRLQSNQYSLWRAHFCTGFDWDASRTLNAMHTRIESKSSDNKFRRFFTFCSPVQGSLCKAVGFALVFYFYFCGAQKVISLTRLAFRWSFDFTWLKCCLDATPNTHFVKSSDISLATRRILFPFNGKAKHISARMCSINRV